ncbi:hypothetical protein LOD99_11511 [Oopsacas minuta]|uniref:Uncharacterized protein n=1 Tax=Oopsacas minuta TaxID=111878 RepID=A0AAV7JJL6_9METZ|nr:hypothetical protein LOD99_11511 [Oopsacas minuta]
MESHYTLPAESYSLTNVITQKQTSSSQPLVGNNLWAVGHVTDSTNQNLFYFDGIKGGECKWHKFQTPGLVADEVQLELGFEGVLGLKMDQSLYLGSVESVQNSAISWSQVSTKCRDFQIGRENICFRNTDSEFLHISQIEAPNESRPLPRISPPSCYCMTSSEDVICLIGSDLQILRSPYSHWLKMSISADRTFFSLFTPKIPNLSKVLLNNGHLCGLSSEGQSISLLPLVNSPSWKELSLSLQIIDVSAVSGHQLSFLLLDRHYTLHIAFLDSSTLRVTELPPSVMPDSNILLTSVRSIRSLFDKPDSIPFSSPSSLSTGDYFFTAGASDCQMDYESAAPSAPAHSQPIEFSDPITADPDPPAESADFPITISNNVSVDPPIEFSDILTPALPINLLNTETADPSAVLSHPVSAELPSDSPADIFSSSTADPLLNQLNNQSNHFFLPNDLSIIDTNSSQSADWLNSSSMSSDIRSDVRTGTKRQLAPNSNLSHKFSKIKVENPYFDARNTSLFSDLTVRTSEERRIDKRNLRERADPCPLKECSFLPVRFDYSYFEDVVCESETRGISPTLLDRTEGILFDQEFDFSAAQKEVTNLSRVYPNTSIVPVSPPPSAPPTQEFSL